MNQGADTGSLDTSLAGEAISLLGRRGASAGTAESLTGGLIAATLTSIPGASAVFAGGVIAYTAEIKATLLGVPAELLNRVGTVHPDVAAAMARGARERLGTDVTVAVTGVAGPESVDGLPVGTVHVAVCSGWSSERMRHLALSLTGSREQIRRDTVRHALRLLVTALTEDNL